MPNNIVLGICAFTHDSSAALFTDNHLVGFLEEDRLVRRKHTAEFPNTAIKLLLRNVNLTPEDVNHVVYTFDSNLYKNQIDDFNNLSFPQTRTSLSVQSYHRIAKQHQNTLSYLTGLFPNAKIHEVPHHIAHAMSGIVFANVDSADLLVLDSIGESATSSMGSFSTTDAGLDINIEAIAWDTDSLGYVYGAITNHLGFQMRDEEGTVMALAALGNPRTYQDLLNELIMIVRSDTYVSFSINKQLVKKRVFGDTGRRLSKKFCDIVPYRPPYEPLTPIHQDIAAALQKRVEEVIVAIATETKSNNLIITGGVATNCVAIGLLRVLFPEKTIFVPPAPGDSGTSLGAAAFVTSLLQHNRIQLSPSPFIGVEPDIPEITHPLLAAFNPLSYNTEDLVDKVASLLVEGKIGGIFREKAEAGPRALGNRSIIANPKDPNVINRLAKSVKRRESFRPFAPAILENKVGKYVKYCKSSPYMSAALPATPKFYDEFPHLVHDNGTVRVQTLQSDSFLGKLLIRFEELTTCQVLINTSLNAKGNPTVGTWEDALHCLRTMDLDFLVLGSTLLRKTI